MALCPAQQGCHHVGCGWQMRVTRTAVAHQPCARGRPQTAAARAHTPSSAAAPGPARPEPAVPDVSSEPSSSGHASPTWSPPLLLRGMRAWLGPGPSARVLAAAAAGAGLLGSGFDLQGPGSILQALGVLAAIITVHEGGHFLAARLQNIHVTQFAIGFGPPLLKFKRGDVEYSLRAVPLGGYVAFPDDDPKSSYDPADPNLLRNRSLPSRALVISAGVIANVIFAYAVLFAQVNVVGKADTAYLPGVVVPEVMAGGAAEEAGFLAGDVILRVGDYQVEASSEQVPGVVSTIKARPNQRLGFLVSRRGQQLALSAVPRPNAAGQGAIGVSLTSNTAITHVRPEGLGGAVALANGEFARLGGTVARGVGQVLTNLPGVAGQLSGPVAIVAQGSEVVRRDAVGLYQFCAIVNLNLALVNVLPLPALDGGYLALLALEGLRGRKLPEEVEQGVMASGLLLLMVLGAGLVIKDTISLL